MTNTQTDKPTPIAEPATREYWERCANEELTIQKCGDCDSVQHYPRLTCLQCGGTLLSLEAASGRGVIRTFTVCRVPVSAAFADDVPYAIALVELEEGPSLMTNIVHCDVDKIEVGQPVQVEFELRGEAKLPVFKPVTAG